MRQADVEDRHRLGYQATLTIFVVEIEVICVHIGAGG
jgi:hypothetical protein